MTTESETGDRIDTATLWHSVGRLEGGVDALKEGQNQIRAEVREGQNQIRAEMREGEERLRTEMREGQEHLRAEIRELNRRMDRLLYAGLTVGGALLVAIAVSHFLGG